MIIREYISDITNSLRANNLDSYIPAKWLFYKTQNIISDFLKKDNSNSKLIYKLSQGWAELGCVQMREVPITSCDVGVNCSKLMKSLHKLPTIYETKFGSLIRSMSSVDYSNTYDNIFTAKLWKNTQSREYKIKKYFFIQDGYLYIPIPKGEIGTPEIVRLDCYPVSLYDVDNFNNIQECGSCKPNSLNCKSPLDYELVCPDYLINDVKKELLNQILSSYGRVQNDDLPNLNKNEITNPKNL